jgi:hypothetical protein
VTPEKRFQLVGMSIGTALAFVLMLGGFFLVRDNSGALGWVMFVLVPIVAGFTVGAILERLRQATGSIVAGALLTLAYMLMTGLEGLLCVVLVLPLLALGLAIGLSIGRVVRRNMIEPRMISRGLLVVLSLVVAPLLIATGDRIEEPTLAEPAVEAIVSERIIPATIDETWELIERMDTLNGERPMLMTLGLPAPYRCELVGEGVGARRLCRFEKGEIRQEVVNWNRPHRMGLVIRESTLPGRHWLRFTNASYELHTVPGGTRVVRTTEITTRLAPRWYWRPLERWGVLSEHGFVFDNVARRALELRLRSRLRDAPRVEEPRAIDDYER